MAAGEWPEKVRMIVTVAVVVVPPPHPMTAISTTTVNRTGRTRFSFLFMVPSSLM